MDKFYFLIGLLDTFGFVMFVLCAKRYRGVQFAGHNEEIGISVINGREGDLIISGKEEVAHIEEIEVVS